MHQINYPTKLSLSLSEGENPRSETPSSTSTATNQTATNTTGNTTPTSQTANSTTPITTTTGPDEEEIEPPAIVVYFVEPFSLGGTEDPDRRRLAILALLRAYSSAINSMPENMRSNIHVQVITDNQIQNLNNEESMIESLWPLGFLF